MVVNTIANELTLLLYSRGQQKYSGCFILNLRVLIFYFRKGYTTSFPLYGISICSGENVVDIWRQAGYTKVAIFFLKLSQNLVVVQFQYYQFFPSRDGSAQNTGTFDS